MTTYDLKMVLKEFRDSIQVTGPMPPTNACVYILSHYGQLTYVGQTKNLVRRLLGHVETKRFDRVYFIPCHKASDRNALESYLIKNLSPPENRVQPLYDDDRISCVRRFRRRTTVPKHHHYREILRRAEHEFDCKLGLKPEIFSLMKLIGHGEANESK